MSTNNRWAEVIKAQPMFDVLSLANKRQQSGNYVARMEIGDTPGFQNSLVNKILLKKSQEPHRYSPSQGETVLIDALFATQWNEFSRSNYDICVAPANFLIMAALAAVTSPGDTILVPDPGFPTYELACKFLGLKTVSYSLYPNTENIFPEIDYLEHSPGEFPDVIIINNPSNPLGIAYDGIQILNSIDSLIKNNVKVIIDETYINLIYDSTKALIPCNDAIRIRTFSKEHCAPGLRIGYVLANHQYTKSISDFISLTISCVPKFIQLTVAEYIVMTESKIFRDLVITEMRRRHKLLVDLMPKKSVLLRPNSSFYAMIETGDADNSFKFFLERNIATCPGSKFGSAAATALRVSIAGDEKTLNKDFDLLSSAYLEWSNK